MEKHKWDFFERIEKLEKTKPVLDEVFLMSVVNFELLFTYIAAQNPSLVRGYREWALNGLKKSNVNKGLIELLDEFMAGICEEN